MQFVIMTVGKTHSGKTTFGMELAKKIKKSCVLDADILSEFLKTTYPVLYQSDREKNSEKKTQWYYLKLSLMIEIFKKALKTDATIVSTAANSNKRIRGRGRLLAHRAWRKLIMIYFNRPENILLERIKKSTRSKVCLTHSKDFNDLLTNKQKKLFEQPSSKEADLFFEINDDQSRKKVQKEIIALVNK